MDHQAQPNSSLLLKSQTPNQVTNSGTACVESLNSLMMSARSGRKSRQDLAFYKLFTKVAWCIYVMWLSVDDSTDALRQPIFMHWIKYLEYQNACCTKDDALIIRFSWETHQSRQGEVEQSGRSFVSVNVFHQVLNEHHRGRVN